MTPDAVAVCVDVGTGAIKAVLFDADGRELAVTRGDTAVAHPTRERSEQDMGEVWDAVVATVREGVPSSPPRWAVRGCLATVRGGSAGPTDAAAPTNLRLCGGGTASPLWCQLIADVTGAEAVCTEDTQTGANGALLTALAALGDHADVSAAAAALVPERHRFVPDKTVQDLHDAEHAEFLATRALVAQRWVHWRAADPGALHG